MRRTVYRALAVAVHVLPGRAAMLVERVAVLEAADAVPALAGTVGRLTSSI
jgi:hypothetical protein